MVDKIRRALMFGESAAVSSYQTLNRFGSTAGASTFYVLAHKESFVGIKKGDKVGCTHVNQYRPPSFMM